MQQTRKQVVQRWLRDQLIRLVNVQRCVLGQPATSSDPVHPADLVVYTWAGVLIYIYLIDEPLKTPKARRILESATGTGIITLFILDAALLPKAGEQVDGSKWFIPLPSLANDRVYTYDLAGSNPIIRPARFVPTSRTMFEIQYGHELLIQQIRHMRQTARHTALKGYWLIADFETERTVHNAGFRAGGGRTQQRHSTNGNTSANGASHASADLPQSRLEMSYALLGISRGATRDEVKMAFRKLAFEVHPDVSQLPKDEAEARFKSLTEAYEFIKTTNAWT